MSLLDLLAPPPEVICPLCAHAFQPGEAHHRMIEQSPVPDTRLSAALSGAVEVDDQTVPWDLPPVRNPASDVQQNSSFKGSTPGGPPTTAGTVKGRGGAFNKVCPSCTFDLPPKLLECRDGGRAIGVFGSHHSGKSCLLGTMLEALDLRHADHCGFSVLSQNVPAKRETDHLQASSQLHKERYQDALKSGRTPALTAQVQDVSEMAPLIYAVTFARKGLWSPRRTLMLVLHDKAGETLDDPNRRRLFLRHIGPSRGLIFVIDPWQLDGIRGLVAEQHHERDRLTDPANTLEQVIHDLDASGRVSRGRFDVPIAVVLTKIDLLARSCVDGVPSRFGRLIRDESRHRGGFDRSDAGRTGLLVQELLNLSLQGRRLQNLTENHFRNVGYFAVSSLGHPPRDKRLERPCEPVRVADPMLWLFYKLGYLPEARGEGGDSSWSN